MGLAEINSIFTLTVQFDEKGQVVACQKVPRTRVYYDDTGETFGVKIFDPLDIGFDEVVELLHITTQNVLLKTNPDNFKIESDDTLDTQ
jgi:hypothetical protein